MKDKLEVKQMEFSKKLTIAILSFWAFSIIAIGTTNILFNAQLEFLMTYINPLAMISTGGMYGKSAYENKFKIQNGEENHNASIAKW